MPKNTAKKADMYKNRVVGSAILPAKEIKLNPRNWRRHPDHQMSALQGVLQDVGWVQNVIVNRVTGHLVDGELRVTIAAARGEDVPVTYVELTQAEENLVLATFDPISSLADTDTAVLNDLLLDNVNSGNADVQALLSNIAAEKGVIPPDFMPVAPDAMPKLDERSAVKCPHCGKTFVPK